MTAKNVSPTSKGQSPGAGTDEIVKTVKTLRKELAEKDRIITSLNENVEQYRNLIDLSPDPVVILQDGIYKLVSSSFTDIFGYTQKEIESGLSFIELVQDGDREAVNKRYSDRLKGKDLPTTYRIDLVGKDGTIIPCETSASMITFDGRPADLAIIRNISERMEIENEVLNLKGMYEMLVTTSPHAISVTNLEGEILFVSDQTLELHGYSDSEHIIGKSALLFIAPEDHDRALANMNKTLTEGSIEFLEYTMMRKDGSQFIGELSAALIRDQEGKPKGFIATVRDISDKKNAENELRRSEEKYRTLTESIREGVYTLDTDGRFTYVNNIILERSGRSQEWFIGRSSFDILRKEDRKKAKKNFKTTMKGKKAPMIEVAYPSETGVGQWVEVNTNPMFQDDTVVGLFGVSRDITERKKFEEVHNVMFDITNAMTTSEGLEDLFRSIQTHLGKVIDTTNFFIALYNPETDMIALPYFIDEADSFTSIPAGKSFTSYVIRNEKPILITESDIDDLVKTGEVEVVGTKPKVWAGVPLKHGDQVIGAVVVQSYTDSTMYSEEDFEVLKFVSDHIALAINRRKLDDALRESEEKYRTLFRFSTDAIFIHDLDLSIIDVNFRGLSLFGYTREEILAMKVSELHPKYAIENSRKAFARIDTDGYVHMKIDFLRKNGDIFTADLSSSRFEIGGEKLVQGIVRDITEQERATKALQESEEKFRTFAERSPNMIFINMQGSIKYVNEKCVEIMGYSRKEFYSPDFDFWRLISPDSIEIIKQKLAEHTSFEEIAPYEYRLVTKDGRIIDAINNSRLIDYDGGKAILGIVTDTTEIRKTEKKLQLSEDRYRKIFESTWEGILVTDTNGFILSANPGAASMLSYQSASDLMGLSVRDLFVTEEKHEALIHDLMEKDHLQNIEFQLKTKDEKIISVLCTASTHTGDVADTNHFQLLFMDITERKLAEEEMKRRLMKFRLEEGNFYLIKESTPTLSIEAFKDLQQIGYQGVLISRALREELSSDITESFEYHWLAEKDSPFTMKPTADVIIERFEALGRRHVVLIDRLDYLIFKIGFKKALSLVQYLREMIYLKGSIVILSIDPQTMKREDLRLLEKETKQVEPLHKNILSDELFNILKFIYRQNTLGIKPSYSAVGKELTITKPTVRKRIGDLIATGYIREDIKGRNKAVELTERGRQLFWK